MPLPGKCLGELMGSVTFDPIEAGFFGIPQWDIEQYLRCHKAIKEGEPFTPEMMKSLTHPYLKKKLLEAVCLRQAG
jgi:hypothetical protein